MAKLHLQVSHVRQPRCTLDTSGTTAPSGESRTAVTMGLGVGGDGVKSTLDTICTTASSGESRTAATMGQE